MEFENDLFDFFQDADGNVKYAGVCMDCTKGCKQSFRVGVVECAKYIPTSQAKYRTLSVMPDCRELTSNQRREINKLVKQCANYDKEENQCLPLDCRCVMLDKVYNRSFCRWFENAVLPLNSALQAVLRNKNTNIKKCGICGQSYPATGNKSYCSEKCRDKAKEQASAERARRYRAKKG